MQLVVGSRQTKDNRNQHPDTASSQHQTDRMASSADSGTANTVILPQYKQQTTSFNQLSASE